MYRVVGASREALKPLKLEHSCISADLYTDLDFLTGPYKPDAISDPLNQKVGAYAIYKTNFLVWVEFAKHPKNSTDSHVCPIHILGTVSDPGQFCLDETGRVLASVNGWREIVVFMNGQQVHSIRPQSLDGSVDEEFSIPVLYQVFSSIQVDEKEDAHSDEEEKAEPRANKRLNQEPANDPTAPGEAYIGNIVYSVEDRVFLATFGAILSVSELSLGVQRVFSVAIDPRKGKIWCLHRIDTDGVNSIVRLNSYTPQGSLRSSTPLELSTKTESATGYKPSQTLVSEIRTPTLLISPDGSCVVGWQCIHKSIGHVGLEYALAVFSKAGKHSWGTRVDFDGHKIILAPRIHLFDGMLVVFNRFIRQLRGVPVSALAVYPLDGKKHDTYEIKLIEGEVWVAPGYRGSTMVKITPGSRWDLFSVEECTITKSSGPSLPVDLGAGQSSFSILKKITTTRTTQHKIPILKKKPRYSKRTSFHSPLVQIAEADEEEEKEEVISPDVISGEENDDHQSDKAKSLVADISPSLAASESVTSTVEQVPPPIPRRPESVPSTVEQVPPPIPRRPESVPSTVEQVPPPIPRRPDPVVSPVQIEHSLPADLMKELDDLLLPSKPTDQEKKTNELVKLDITFPADSTRNGQPGVPGSLEINLGPVEHADDPTIGDLSIEATNLRKVSEPQTKPAEVEMDFDLEDEPTLEEYLEAEGELSSPPLPPASPPLQPASPRK